LSALAGSPMESVEAMAWPPFFLISSTTCWAGPASPPEPSSAAPTSLTSTLAPSWAISMAMARPMPRPAPVTMATLSLTMSGIFLHPLHTLGVTPGLDPGVHDETLRVLTLPLFQEVRHHGFFWPHTRGQGVVCGVCRGRTR